MREGMVKVKAIPLKIPNKNKTKAMTQSNKRMLLTIAVMFIIMILPILASAQVDDPYDTNGGLDPDGAPLDGGLSLLVAAGVGYGAKKMKERKNKTININ